ncbi:MAG: glycosyltransferase family 4 protein [Acidimicrobiia bacterium]|nr:glycosyltransferase family 4 protein [Acidimicrobiia bacterium]
MTEATREAPVIETIAGAGVVLVENDPSPLGSIGTDALCADLAARGVPTVLLTAKRDRVSPLPDSYAVDMRLRAVEDHAFPVRVLLQIWNLLVLSRVLRTSGVNVVINQVRRPRRFDLVLLRALHLMHRRVVFAPRRLTPGTTPDSRLPRFARKVYRKADAIVLRSLADSSRLRILIPEAAVRSRVIPPGAVDVSDEPVAPPQSEARRRLGLTQRQAVVLGIADEPDGRGAEDFIDAVAVLRGSVEAVLTGTAVDIHFPRLARRVEELELTGSLELVPTVEVRAQPSLFLSACDVVVIPNRQVSDPELASYAAGHARPVIVTDVSGFAEVLEAGVPGTSVSAGDPRALAEGVTEIVFPRRRLQQEHWELETRPPKMRTWGEAAAGYVPLLDLHGTRTGRRMPTRSLKIWIGVLYMFVLLVTLGMVGANIDKGFSAFNIGLIMGILLPAAALFLLLVPFDVKFLSYWAVLFFFDIGVRAFPEMPLQYAPTLIVVAMTVHLILESPPDRVTLKRTRLLHALLIMQAGWALAEMFNPNMSEWGSTIKMIRLIIEPLLVYVCALTYFRNSVNVRRFVDVYLVVGGLAALYGVKIAFFGYFGFEEAALRGSMAMSESRNIGTMGAPQVWGMWMMHVALLGFALLIERRAWRHKWWLLIVVPAAVLNVITAGQRIQFLGIAVAVPLIIALSIGNPATRLRAVVALFLAGTAAVFVWFWIPGEGSNRAALSGKDPITAARMKLATLKDPDSDEEVLEARLTNGGNTFEAVLAHPLGGGTGLTYVAKISDPISQGNPTQVIGQTDVQSTRARNQIPMQTGDFFFINWMAEQGVVGVILIGLIFGLMVLWNLYAATHARVPVHRALCATGFVWGIAYIINSNTNDAFFSPVSSSGFFAFLALAVCIMAIEDKELGPIEPTAPLPSPG